MRRFYDGNGKLNARHTYVFEYIKARKAEDPRSYSQEEITAFAVTAEAEFEKLLIEVGDTPKSKSYVYSNSVKRQELREASNFFTKNAAEQTSKPENRKKMVTRMARYLGCAGTHTSPDGQLMPCSSHEELMKISEDAEPPKKKDNKKQRPNDDHEPLRRRGVVGINTMPGGGLVSAPIGKSFVSGRALPRIGDFDVYTNPSSARERSRSLGCIGISRRLTPEGLSVWMPCTNMSDYRRRTGVGVQAERDREKNERRLLRRLRSNNKF